jgi:predicted DNA-binding transcriptional regulator YafY
MTREPWLISGLLSFGTQVEVIEPAYLKTQLAEKAKEIYEMNKA